jgi:hypothetical protein
MRDADGTLRGISDAEPSDCERVAAGTDPEHSSCSCPPERSALEIARRDGTLVHRMRSERASRTELPLAQIEPGRVAFASPDDHRIAYRLEGDVLTVSVDAAPARAFRRVPR